MFGGRVGIGRGMVSGSGGRQRTWCSIPAIRSGSGCSGNGRERCLGRLDFLDQVVLEVLEMALQYTEE